MQILQFQKAKDLLKEADILLFRHPRFPKLGWFVSRYTQSPYSHVGLYHKEKKDHYCVEFKEFIGSRVYPLEKYIDEGALIDVFRVFPEVTIPVVEEINTLKIKGFYNDTKKLKFTDEISKNITGDAIKLVEANTPYGWSVIWRIAKGFVPGLRLANGDKFIDNREKNIYVCSTLITYTYRKHYIDPVNFLADDYTKPGDIARSSIIKKIIEIRK